MQRARRPPYFLTTALITFLLVTGLNILVPALPLYAASFGVSAAQVGLVISTFAVGRFLFDIVGGTLADRFGVKAVAVTGCAITGLASVLAAVTTSFAVLLVARAVQGIGSALYITSAMGLVIALAPPGGAGRLLATYQGIFMLGLALGPAIGGVTASAFGLKAPFFAYALMAFLGCALALVRLPSRDGVTAMVDGSAPGGDPGTRWPLVRQLLSGRAFVFSLAATAVLFWIRSGVRTTLLPLYVEERMGMDAAMIGVLLTVMAVGNIGALRHAGTLLDRRGRKPVIVGSLVLTAIGVALFAVVRQPWALFPAALVFGVVSGYSGSAPVAVLADVADPRIRGTAVGIQRMSTDLGLLVGPISLGALVDVFSFETTFALAALLVLVTALAALGMPETRPLPADGDGERGREVASRPLSHPRSG